MKVGVVEHQIPRKNQFRVLLFGSYKKEFYGGVDKQYTDCDMISTISIFDSPTERNLHPETPSVLFLLSDNYEVTWSVEFMSY